MPFSFKAPFFFCLIQLVFALSLAPYPKELPSYLGWKSLYSQLNNWDSFHYLDIAQNGYRFHGKLEEVKSEDVHSGRANVAYFPAYPLISRFVAKGVNVRYQTSLLVVAQVFCLIFWVYFYLILNKNKWTNQQKVLCGVCAALFPASFFLVTGYSESLFLASILGFIYHSSELFLKSNQSALQRYKHFFMASGWGFLMTGTRFVGIPLTIFPFFLSLQVKRESYLSVFIFLFSMMGAMSFFVYSAIQFGHWDLYLKLQEKGWQNHPDYFAILKPLSYLPRFFFEDTMRSISRASIPFCVGFGVWCVNQNKKNHSLDLEKYGYFWIAFIMFYISLSGKANAEMDSMIRYAFPVYIILLLSLNHFPEWRLSRRTVFLLSFFFILQAWMAYLFLRGHWVA